MEFNELIAHKLQQHRGKFANVIFTKKDGSERSMNFMQGAKKGLRNGLWANGTCLLYTSPSPRDRTRSRMPSSA